MTAPSANSVACSDACTRASRSVVGACRREPLSEPRAVHSMPSEDAASGVSLARGGGRLLLVFVEEVIDLGVISDRHLREHTPISRRARLFSSRISRALSGRRKPPYFGGHSKSRLPLTDPSFLPTGSSY